jgi:hypothetical protein
MDHEPQRPRGAKHPNELATRQQRSPRRAPRPITLAVDLGPLANLAGTWKASAQLGPSESAFTPRPRVLPHSTQRTSPKAAPRPPA